jgi:hypothetical protein
VRLREAEAKVVFFFPSIWTYAETNLWHPVANVHKVVAPKSPWDMDRKWQNRAASEMHWPVVLALIKDRSPKVAPQICCTFHHFHQGLGHNSAITMVILSFPPRVNSAIVRPRSAGNFTHFPFLVTVNFPFILHLRVGKLYSMKVTMNFPLSLHKDCVYYLDMVQNWVPNHLDC